MCARVCPCAVRACARARVCARLWASLTGADAGLGGSPRSPAMSWLYEWGQPASSLSAAPLCVSGGFFLMTGRGDSASLTTSPTELCRAHAQKGLSLVRACWRRFEIPARSSHLHCVPRPAGPVASPGGDTRLPTQGEASSRSPAWWARPRHAPRRSLVGSPALILPHTWPAGAAWQVLLASWRCGTGSP